MPKRTPSSTNNRIREIRTAKGVRQEELADAAHISRSALSRYEQATFIGSIPTDVQKAIATALDAPIERVFPTTTVHFQQDPALSRRDLLTGGAGILGASLVFGATDPFGLASPLSTWTSRRQDLSPEEIRTLADSNFSAWMLFESMQRGTTIEYVTAIAQGQIAALRHLSSGSLLPGQKSTMLLLMGDMYLLLGRLARETQNYGFGESVFAEAMKIAHEIDNCDATHKSPPCDR